MWTNRGGTTFSQRADAKSPKSSTACYLHRWKNHRTARPVAPRKLLEVIRGWREHFDSTFAQCSYGSYRWRPDMTSLLISLSTAVAKTDPASCNQGKIIWSSLIVFLREVSSGDLQFERWGSPQMGRVDSPVPPQRNCWLVNVIKLSAVEQQSCADQLTPLLSEPCRLTLVALRSNNYAKWNTS